MMGRHSEERDTAGNGPQDALSAREPGSGVLLWLLGKPDGTDELRLIEDTDDLTLPFDDVTALWDFRPFLRPYLDVQLPEADQ